MSGEPPLELVRRLEAAIGRALVGKPEVVRLAVVGLLARGHLLIEDVPGVGKTTLAAALARSIGAGFQRIQFTSDMLPSDVLGVSVWEPKRGDFVFKPGPLFTNIVLADEINRTTPKTQSSLLEAMQEHQVTIGGSTYKLPEPFFVLATQNPIEQEGTYPLPEAQQDRFFFKVLVRYPSRAEEMKIIEMAGKSYGIPIDPVLNGEEILALQEIVLKVPCAEHVMSYAMDLVRQTRVLTDEAPGFIKEWVSWGAGPRASQYLVLGAKARAVLHGRYYVSTEDIRAVAGPVLRHRIITNFNAEAEGIKPHEITARLANVIPRDPNEK